MQSARLGTWPRVAGGALPPCITVSVIAWPIAVRETGCQLEDPSAMSQLLVMILLLLHLFLLE